MSEGQIQQLHTTFSLLDSDGDGRIDAVDLQKFLSTFNSNFSLQELEAFINDQACHPNGMLDFPEFLTMLSRLICDSLDVAPEIDEDEMKRVFDSWDKDGDGLISANDLREVVTSAGEVCACASCAVRSPTWLCRTFACLHAWCRCTPAHTAQRDSCVCVCACVLLCALGQCARLPVSVQQAQRQQKDAHSQNVKGALDKAQRASAAHAPNTHALASASVQCTLAHTRHVPRH